jgi:hypothetical protein
MVSSNQNLWWLIFSSLKFHSFTGFKVFTFSAVKPILSIETLENKKLKKEFLTSKIESTWNWSGDFRGSYNDYWVGKESAVISYVGLSEFCPSWQWKKIVRGRNRKLYIKQILKDE